MATAESSEIAKRISLQEKAPIHKFHQDGNEGSSPIIGARVEHKRSIELITGDCSIGTHVVRLKILEDAT